MPTKTEAYTRLLHIGKTSRGGDVEISVTIRDTDKGPELSISGAVWQANRRDIESGGQNYDSIREDVHTMAIPEEKLERILTIWRRWHLNGLKAGCEHQRATWNAAQPLEVVHYGLTYEASRLRVETREALANAALKGETLTLSDTARALAGLTDWFKDLPYPPDADSPLSGCYEVKKRETKTAGWVYPAEHSEGLLTKPCPVCGYKYGSAWQYEPLPQEVIAEVKSW